MALPIFTYDFNYSDNITGIDYWSLVEFPAIEVDFISMSKEKKVEFTINTEKQMIYGPVLIPDQLIYRNSPEIGEYYGKFSKDTINLLNRKFFKTQKTLNINVEHKPDSKIDAVIVESWIVSAENDKSIALGFNLPEGTWFGAVYIEDKAFWDNQIKTKKVKGFSIEGWLSQHLEQMEKENKIKMKKTVTKLTLSTEVKTVDGMVLYSTWDKFDIGADVYTVDGNGNDVPAPDGEYKLEDGTVLVVLSGYVSDVKTLTVEAEVVEQKEITIEEFALTDSDVMQIMDAIQPKLDELNQRISDLEMALGEFKSQNESLRAQLSTVPGVVIPATVNSEKEATKKLEYSKMTPEQKAEYLRNYGKRN